MLKIKWNLVPPQFKYGVIERASGDVCVCIHPPVINVRVNDWDYNPEGQLDNYLHELCKGEYEYPDYDHRSNWDNRIYSREDWEREQWALAPEWAMYHVTQPDGSSQWSQYTPLVFNDCWVNSRSDNLSETSFVVFQYGEDWKQSLRKRPEAKVNTLLQIDMKELATIISDSVIKTLEEITKSKVNQK